MQKRYLPITVSVVIMAVVALAGYLRPAATEPMPRRILFDNTGGKVIFTHLAHSNNEGIQCAACHHESGAPGSHPLRCASCHPAEFTPQYLAGHQDLFATAQHCARCHHAEFTGLSWNHDEHVNHYNDGSCLDCHHDPSIEPTPQRCGDCHHGSGDDAMPGRADAAHQRCLDCHQDSFDEKMAGCQFCHISVNDGQGDVLPATGQCRSCHFQTLEQLIPTRMKAFHDGCMGCHAKTGTGPYAEDACHHCHLPR